MIADVIERLGSRLGLWRRELSEWYSVPPPARLRQKEEEAARRRSGDYVSAYRNPKRIRLLKESAIISAVRMFLSYSCVIALVSEGCVLGGLFFPSARFSLAMGCVGFAVFWTFVWTARQFNLYKARKQYREEIAAKTSH